MEGSFFKEKSAKPDDQSLAQALGKTARHWDKIKSSLAEEYGELTEEWKFYSKKSGWTLKTLRKKRNLFFFEPRDGYFRIIFVFGDKAVALVKDSNLPDAIKEELRNARKYAEGRGLTIEVKSAKETKLILQLVEIKLAN